MGWSRDESLKALEQFDYNIDKVSSSTCALEFEAECTDYNSRRLTT